MKRAGENFFAESRKDALSLLHPDDNERFIEAFTKENILKTIDED